MGKPKNDDKKSSGKDSGGKGAKAKGGKTDKDEQSDSKAKGAQSINVRHILVSSPPSSFGPFYLTSNTGGPVREAWQKGRGVGEAQGWGQVRRRGQRVLRGQS